MTKPTHFLGQLSDPLFLKLKSIYQSLVDFSVNWVPQIFDLPVVVAHFKTQPLFGILIGKKVFISLSPKIYKSCKISERTGVFQNVVVYMFVTKVCRSQARRNVSHFSSSATMFDHHVLNIDLCSSFSFYFFIMLGYFLFTF